MTLKNKVAEMATNNDTKKACDSDSKDEEHKYMYNSEIPTGNYASASICETMGFEIRLCIPPPPLYATWTSPIMHPICPQNFA